MGIKKLKERKKKNRERATRQKVLERRTELRLQRKLYKEEEMREKEAHDIVHGKEMPFIKNKQEISKDKVISDKLANNLKILEALEQEYDEEQDRRTEVNQKLEAEGHKSIREKMDALHQKALAITGKDKELADAQEEYDKEIIVSEE